MGVTLSPSKSERKAFALMLRAPQHDIPVSDSDSKPDPPFAFIAKDKLFGIDDLCQ
ncbi:MAG: hypothetical protein JWR50_3879 [Mucilaginibacter sp.]|nr:hypothetical protein [Mucilaginibacter sp.]